MRKLYFLLILVSLLFVMSKASAQCSINLTSPGADAQTVCVNSPIANITYSSTNATGAVFTNLPAGVFGFWVDNIITIIGTPSAAGSYQYSIELTGSCGTGINTATGNITVKPVSKLTLVSAPGSDAQNVCTNTAIDTIIYKTTNATGAVVTGLPTGISARFVTDSVIIAGKPNSSIGSFLYSVNVTGGCGTVATTGMISIIAGPTLTSAKSASICNDLLFHYVATSSTPANFSWTRDVVPGISDPASAGNTATINETLHNTTSEPVLVIYRFLISTGTGGGCDAKDSLLLTVNPTPTIDPVADMTFCNGSAINGISFTSSSPNALFTWTNSNTSIGLPASGSGSITSFTATNTGSSATFGIVNVKASFAAGNCTGPTISFVINVLPAPTLTSAKTDYICNDVPFQYTATSFAANTNFSWIRGPIAGITPASASASTGTISETLHNATDQPKVVKYEFVLSTGTASGCVTTESLLVTVYPTPVLATLRDTTFCNSMSVANGIPFSSSTPGATFTWTNSNPAIGLANAGTGSIPPFSATNNGNSSIFGIINVSIKRSDPNCAGPGASFAITVLPGPSLTSAKTHSVCDSALFNYTATSSATNTVFSWTRAVATGIKNTASTGIGATVNERLDNETSQPVVVSYVFTLSTGSVCGITETVLVTVYPTPAVESINNMSVCNGTQVTTIQFNSSSPNSVYTWTSNVNIGFGMSGINSIPAFSAINNSNIPIIATVTVSIKAGSDSCAGSNKSFTITVLPGPALTSPKTSSICNNALFNYTATSSAANTVFSWSRAAVTGISNGAASGSTAFISETLNNTTDQPISVKYAINLSTGSSCSYTDALVVIVNPTPNINAVSMPPICNGTPVNTIEFSSSSPAASFSWSSSQNIGFGTTGIDSIHHFSAINTTNAPITSIVVVSVTASSDRCPGPNRSFSITVLPGPTLTSVKTLSVCDSAVFNYTATSSAANTTFSWTRAAVTGISNPTTSRNGALVDERLKNTTEQPINVTYVFNLSTGSGCDKSEVVIVTVEPTPTINRISPLSFCSGTTVNGIEFSSNSPTPSFTWTSSQSVGFGTSGTGNISSFIATNTTNDSIRTVVTVSIKAGSNNCIGPSDSFVIIVRPGPMLTSAKTRSVCDTALFNYTATSSAVNTSFKWTRAAVNGISNTADSSKNASISEHLHNTTTLPITVKYFFILETGASCRTTDSLLVTVHPTPTIAPLRELIFCNGTPVVGIPFSSNSPDSSFTWTSTQSVGFGTSGTGSISSFVATNTNTDSVKAIVTVGIKAGSPNCPGPSDSFAIIVRPTPRLTSARSLSICDGSLFTTNATSSTANTTFNWRREPVNGISNSAATGSTAIISETLINTTSQPIQVRYFFTLQIGNGCDKTDTLFVTVNPTPIINRVSNYTVCNNDVFPGISFTSPSPNASFKWSSSKSIGFGLSGTGSIPSFIADNRTNNVIIDTITLSISASSDSCRGADSSFIITVLPTPALTSSKTAGVCDNAPFSYSATSSAPNTSFTWTRPAVSGISNTPGNGNSGVINERLDNTTSNPVEVIYFFSLQTGPGAGCTTIDSLKVMVNTTPRVNAVSNIIYCNGESVRGINFTSATTGASFMWTAVPSIGFGIIGTGSISPFTATNITNSPITSIIRVVASQGSCVGVDTMMFNITVNPSPTRPFFKSLSRYADFDTLSLCAGSNNINFNINQPEAGVTYAWSANSSSIVVRDRNDANTVASFNNTGTYVMKVVATNNAYSCQDTVTQVVKISATAGIDERKIILKQPGNLLIYPDNSLNQADGYQWGYDSLVRILPDSAFSIPKPLAGQVYQYLVPDKRFINTNNLLDTSKYSYWVLLKQGDCYSRVYYNGPYATGRIRPADADLIAIEANIYPNPNNGIFSIRLKGNIYGRMRATIYNSLGQPVFSSQFEKTTPVFDEQFNTQHLAAGIYNLVVRGSDLKKAETRFIIQH
jgi:hypothetical protein